MEAERTWEEFERLRDCVEAQSGNLVDALCEHRVHQFPDLRVAQVPEARGEVGIRAAFSYEAKGCGNHTVFEVPYVVQKPSLASGEPLIMGRVKLCALCDNMWSMPRFRGD